MSQTIWTKDTSLARLNQLCVGNMLAHLGIEFTAVGEDWLEGSMPVDERTVQPYGLLHGGASVVLAETLGSVAGNLCISSDKMAVGQEINANHVRSVHQGKVLARAQAKYLGGRTQVWNIDVWDDEGRLVCTSRLTLAVVPKRLSKLDAGQ